MDSPPVGADRNRSSTATAGFSRYMWVNLLQMLVMILLVNFVASNDRLFHERMRMEHLMKENSMKKALEVGEKSLKTDSSLTMLHV